MVCGDSGQLRCHLLPDWETLPYDAFSPHQDLVSERLATLHRNRAPASATCCWCRPPPRWCAWRRPSYLAARTFFFKQGEKLDEARLKAQLTLAGYTHVRRCCRPANTRARRADRPVPDGPRAALPVDLFGDQIETIRTFDVDTQRSLYPVREVRLLPAREFPMDEAARTLSAPSRELRRRSVALARVQGHQQRHRSRRHRILPAAVLRRHRHAVRLSAGRHDVRLHRRYRGAIKRSGATRSRATTSCTADRERPLLAPEALFLGDEEFFTLAKPYDGWVIQRGGVTSELSAPIPNIAVNRHNEDPLINLRAYLLQSVGA